MQENSQKFAATSIRGLEEDFIPTPYGIDKDLFTNEVGVSIDTLYRTARASPEVTASLLALLEDIIADNWKLINHSSSARTKKEKEKEAKEFERKARFLRKLTDGVFDLLVTGNGYILKLSIEEEKLSTLVTNMTRSVAKKFKVKGFFSQKKVLELVKQNLKSDKPKDLQVLKASTVKINYDETGAIKSYEQKVQSKTRVYDAKDVIHLKTLSIGGQPYGFTSLEPLLSDIALLLFAKNYAGKYFENDGTPTFMMNMPRESPNGRNYKNLKKELKELKKKTQKYRTLITTGEINVDQITKFNKDLEYSKLIDHWTRLILMGLGLPARRVHYAGMQKDEEVKAAGKDDSGYQKKISFTQKAIEEVFNLELWSLFDVEMKFNRSYKIDEMREAEITRILSEVGAITIEEARERIGMEPEIPKGTMARSIGSDNRARDQSNTNAEQNPQTSDDKRDNKLKMKLTKAKYKSFNSDAIKVSFETFKSIVEKQMGVGNFVKGNVLYLETEAEFILFFSDSNWKYKARVLKKTPEENEEFRLEVLRNFIKLTI